MDIVAFLVLICDPFCISCFHYVVSLVFLYKFEECCVFLAFIMLLAVCILYLLCRQLFVSGIYFVDYFVKHT